MEAAATAAAIVDRRLADGYRPDPQGGWSYIDEYDPIVGSTWHYVTPAGYLVHYPNAYRRAFGRPQYVHSTYRLQVGSAWIDSACPSR
jgi:hypothetical protein